MVVSFMYQLSYSKVLFTVEAVSIYHYDDNTVLVDALRREFECLYIEKVDYNIAYANMMHNQPVDFTKYTFKRKKGEKDR